MQDDLGYALAHRYDDWDHETGNVRWFDIGRVTVVYTVIEELGMMGSGCTFAKKYVSHHGTIIWIHTTFDKRKTRHTLKDTFTVYPP